MRYILLAILTLSIVLRAEVQTPSLPPGNYNVLPSVPPKINPNSMTVIDDKFFDPKKEEPQKSNDTGRYLGENDSINTADRAKILEKCDPLKGVDQAAYRKCYQTEKQQTVRAIRQGFDDVEKRQAIPLQDTPSEIFNENRDPGSDESD